MTKHDSERRSFLLASGGALTIALAGCIGSETQVPGTVDEPDEADDTADDDGNGDVDDEVAAHLDGVGNFDEVHDYTGEEEVTVLNGEVDGIDQTFVFDPAAIRIEAGTTVVWEWAGGDTHSVTDVDGEFDSDLLSGDGETWDYTFDEPGTYLYVCTPHEALDQKGAVIVE